MGGAGRVIAREISEMVECSVCLSSPTHPTETNCGHTFCANCILDYWRADRYPRPCRCPVCRRDINLLMPLRGGQPTQDSRRLDRNICDYNHRMAGDHIPIVTQVRDSPTLLHHVWMELFTLGGLSCCNKLWITTLFLLALVYLLSPVDLLPEAVLGPLGLLDDLIAILGALFYIAQTYRQDVLNRH